MIELTDEMVEAFMAAVERNCGRRLVPFTVSAVLPAVLVLVERQVQEQYGEAYQRGWWHGQHRLCPRCGVELEREVAAERGAALTEKGADRG